MSGSGGDGVFFAHVGGEQKGPLTRAQLLAMAADGRLAPDDLVWESGTPEWVKAADAFPRSAPPAAAPPPVPPPPPGPRPWPAPAPPTIGERVASDLGTLESSELLPLRRVAEPEVLGVASTWILLGFGLVPILIAALVEEPALKGRLFRLSAGAAWSVFFVSTFRVPRVSRRAGAALYAAGALAAALLVSALAGVPPVSWGNDLLDPGRSWPARAAGGLVLALLFEGAKVGCVVLIGRALGGLGGAADGVFSGVLAGLGFGLWEGAAAGGWAGANAGGFLSLVRGPSEGLEGIFVSSLARAVALPALEAAWGGIAGFFAGLAAARKAPFVLVPGLLLVALLHGLYAGGDLLAAVAAALSLLFFLAFRREAAAAPGARV